jgi:hypothetical protein
MNQTEDEEEDENEEVSKEGSSSFLARTSTGKEPQT